mmetsp:Transcript_25662/g.59276  ORF Transcript_25662/g.59276 Transcript_25662/m.59276 type:complete len:187 (-) Transcript_25662:105-665(-)
MSTMLFGRSNCEIVVECVPWSPLMEGRSSNSRPLIIKSLQRKSVTLTQAALERNPKAYGASMRRKWILQHVKASSSVLQAELALTAQFLELDERNFHCWNHRRFVVACLSPTRPPSPPPPRPPRTWPLRPPCPPSVSPPLWLARPPLRPLPVGPPFCAALSPRLPRPLPRPPGVTDAMVGGKKREN